jgi:hypothetical protein
MQQPMKRITTPCMTFPFQLRFGFDAGIMQILHMAQFKAARTIVKIL